MGTASLPGQDDVGRPLAVPTVPLRPDGWPELLRRRPLSSGERERLREALAGELPEEIPAGPAPVTCYLIIDGLDPADSGKLIRLRGRVHAAARTAAEGRQTTYDATPTTISIGIRGPDAGERVGRLRSALDGRITRNGWTAREVPGSQGGHGADRQGTQG